MVALFNNKVTTSIVFKNKRLIENYLHFYKIAMWSYSIFASSSTIVKFLATDCSMIIVDLGVKVK